MQIMADAAFTCDCRGVAVWLRLPPAGSLSVAYPAHGYYRVRNPIRPLFGTLQVALITSPHSCRAMSFLDIHYPLMTGIAGRQTIFLHALRAFLQFIFMTWKALLLVLGRMKKILFKAGRRGHIIH